MDYETKLQFPLPIMTKKIDINITKLLPKLLDIAENSTNKE